MKSVPYSPFNKTYKYLCLQNQLFHNKSKVTQKGLTDSNIKIQKCQSNTQKNHKSLGKTFDSWRSQKSIGGSLKKESQVIHRDSRYDSREKERIRLQNSRHIRKLEESKCKIISSRQAQKDYQKSQIYKNIAMKFDKHSQNKELIFFTTPSLLSNFASSDPNTSRYLCRTSASRRKPSFL